MNLVDTSGWIEYFFDEPNATYFATPIESHPKATLCCPGVKPNATYFATPIERAKDLIVPVICLYEIFKKVNIAADETRAIQAVAHMKKGNIVDITEDIAISAALISLKHKLPMADSLIYATARSREAVLWTQDDHFRSLPGVNFIDARIKKTKQ